MRIDHTRPEVIVQLTKNFVTYSNNDYDNILGNVKVWLSQKRPAIRKTRNSYGYICFKWKTGRKQLKQFLSCASIHENENNIDTWWIQRSLKI